MQFWVRDFVIKTKHKKSRNTVVFRDFLCRINGKYQTKTNSSPSEDALAGSFFVFFKVLNEDRLKYNILRGGRDGCFIAF